MHFECECHRLMVCCVPPFSRSGRRQNWCAEGVSFAGTASQRSNHCCLRPMKWARAKKLWPISVRAGAPDLTRTSRWLRSDSHWTLNGSQKIVRTPSTRADRHTMRRGSPACQRSPAFFREGLQELPSYASPIHPRREVRRARGSTRCAPPVCA